MNAHLLVTSYDLSSKLVTVEIIHDALLREWGLLKWWLKRDGPFLRWHQELERRVQAWIETNPNETRYIDRLLKGSSLSEFEGWMELRNADLSEVEQQFIKASREQQNQEDLRWKKLYEKVEQQRQEAVRQREEAEKQRAESERQRHIALARQLTAQAELLRGQQGHLLQRSVLLAIEALQRSPSLEVDQALRYGLSLLPRPITHFAPRGDLTAIALSSDGRYLVRATEDSNLEVWDVSSGQQLLCQFVEAGVNYVVFSQDARYFATVGTDSKVRVWETGSGNRVACLFNGSHVKSVLLSRDARYLVSTSGEDIVGWVWEVVTNRSKVWSVVFSPAGAARMDTLVATASKDHTARVRNMSRGNQISRFTHDDSVNALAFSPDGTYLATASDDHTTRVWEIDSGRQCAYLPHKDSVNGVAFSPNGHYLATASMDGIARVWLWRSEDLLIEAQARLTRNLTQAEWQQYLGEEPYRKTCPNLPEETFIEDVGM